jgi:hypothetical protein
MMPVSVFVTLMVAFGTAPPVESVTVPVIDAVPVWAIAMPQQAATAKVRTAIHLLARM